MLDIQLVYIRLFMSMIKYIIHHRHIFDDLKKIEDLVYDQIGFVPKYIRFPGGSSNNVSKEYCYKIMTKLTKEVINRGYQYYDWE